MRLNGLFNELKLQLGVISITDIGFVEFQDLF